MREAGRLLALLAVLLGEGKLGLRRELDSRRQPALAPELSGRGAGAL